MGIGYKRKFFIRTHLYPRCTLYVLLQFLVKINVLQNLEHSFLREILSCMGKNSEYTVPFIIQTINRHLTEEKIVHFVFEFVNHYCCFYCLNGFDFINWNGSTRLNENWFNCLLCLTKSTLLFELTFFADILKYCPLYQCSVATETPLHNKYSRFQFWTHITNKNYFHFL